jgi:hypothetical protein
VLVSNAVQFYILRDGKRIGPFEESAVISSWRAGALTNETLVCTQDLGEWTPLGKLIVVEPSTESKGGTKATTPKVETIERVAAQLNTIRNRAAQRVQEIWKQRRWHWSQAMTVTIAVVLGAVAILFLFSRSLSTDKEKKAKIQSFRDHLSTASGAYYQEFEILKEVLRTAARNTSSDSILANSMKYSMPNIPESRFEKVIASNFAAAEREFEDIYVHYHLPSGAKDDFYELKSILDRHLMFVANLREGQLSAGGVKEWVDDMREFGNRYDKIKLEAERL